MTLLKNWRWMIVPLVVCAPSLAANTHPAVQAALDWELPQNSCGVAPNMRKGSDWTNETQETVTSDVDHYTRSRYKRQMKRWYKCNDKYRTQLIEDFGAMRDCVKHGMTQDQAELVLAKLKLIQDTLEQTPTGQS